MTPIPMCIASAPFPVQVSGPAQSAILLWFNGRVVGSGYIGDSGNTTIPLIVGAERPGVYQVQVTLRDSTRVLKELSCQVP